jgi:hypothetical protein
MKEPMIVCTPLSIYRFVSYTDNYDNRRIFKEAIYTHSNCCGLIDYPSIEAYRGHYPHIEYTEYMFKKGSDLSINNILMGSG